MQQHILHNINVVLYKCKYIVYKTIMQCLNETVLDIHQPAHGYMIPSHTISMHRLHQHNIHIECNKRVQTSIIMQVPYICNSFCWHKSWDVPYASRIMYRFEFHCRAGFVEYWKGNLLLSHHLSCYKFLNWQLQCPIWLFETAWLPLCTNDSFVLKSNAFPMSGAIHVYCNSQCVYVVLSCMVACIGYFFLSGTYFTRFFHWIKSMHKWLHPWFSMGLNFSSMPLLHKPP